MGILNRKRPRWPGAFGLPFCLLLLLTGADSLAAQEKRFTAYNLWCERPEAIASINYKKGPFLPAGTEIRDVRVVSHRNRSLIEFTAVKENRAFRIQFSPKHHPGTSIDAFRDGLVTSKPFAQLAGGLTAPEVEAIRQGKVVQGMSKRAVLVGYGPPPEHRTLTPQQNTWIYWTSRYVRKKVIFGADNRVVQIKVGI